MKEYIERASLMGALTSGTEQLAMREMTGAEAYAEFVRLVNFAPAADVVEVRHGRWIEDERTYPGPGLKNNLCSVCGEIAGSWKEGLEPGRKWAYCPNCGARMGKEDEHEAG